MANKKTKRKPPPRRRKRPASPAATSERIEKRSQRMKPLTATGESTEDAAVFDDAALKSLPEDLAGEAAAVRESLSAVETGDDKRATDLLSKIPRKSPYSQWRMFIRGLIDWYRGDATKADEAFSRLDQDRRPARIAATLVEAKQWPAAEPLRPGAAFARSVLIERPALKEARDILLKKEIIPAEIRGDVLIGWERLDVLIEFFKAHRQFEPRLVAALGEEVISRLFQMTFVDLYERGIKSIPGPPHDPNHTLRNHFYFSRFRSSNAKSEQSLERYLNDELPKNQQLSPAMRGAIAAQLHFGRAMEDIATLAQSPFAQLGIDPFEENTDLEEQIFRGLEAATKSFPKFERAHQERTKWIRQFAEDQDQRKDDRAYWEQCLAEAMRDWSEGLPECIEPRLWLVDYYLENEELDLAQPHVDWLGKSRHSDPRVRATRWKWCLLEAMRLCRRKAWLGQVAEQLDQAEACWPNWLSPTWSGYLRAALALRQGDAEQYQQRRAEARAALDGGDEADLADAVMMLGAAQRMRVPSADLKPLRVPIDSAAKNTSALSSKTLLLAGAFFYDLHRTGLLYPAYRMHGGKFADELFSRIETTAECNKVLELEVPGWPAICWLSTRTLFAGTFQPKLPAGLQKAGSKLNPDLTAALELQAILQVPRLNRKPRQLSALVQRVRAAADAQTDPFQRHWFNTLVREGEMVSTADSDFEDSFRKMFERVIDGVAPDWESDEDDDFYEDDEDTFDPYCDCEHCTRARERLGIPHPINEEDGDEGIDQRTGPAMRLDPAELPFGEPAAPVNLDPNVEPPPPSTPAPRPKFEVDPERRRNRPKNPMKKRKSR
ncbi:hypothetical protein NZK35_12270 [Stieleria sp. ICT_E10.1]|uniref:hypothetical protein n=1 Tax=Stieleria sedimenti TaxID=2976331 RepID=UPI00218077B9|nr:hypothetical protein [Stieleria sedimenti]MCS7467421.1 hypothetical protein [Stieleria sedimenti]